MTKNERKTTLPITSRKRTDRADSRDNSSPRRTRTITQPIRIATTSISPVTMKSTKKSTVFRGTNQLAMSRRNPTLTPQSTHLSPKNGLQIFIRLHSIRLFHLASRYFALYEATPTPIHTAYLSSVRITVSGMSGSPSPSRSPVGSSKPVQALIQI